ncbi:MAG TPA: hypothetical protein VF938_01730, partial [Candidatus Angelobacter sp.]
SFQAPTADTKYAFKVIDQGADVVSVRLSRIDPCEPSRWLPEYDGLDTICGSFAVQLEKDDLALKRYVFDAANLPVSANVDFIGTAIISGYHAEVEFQKVFLPDDPKPFLVPKQITVTVTTDKGKLVISSTYVPDLPRRK